MIEGVAGGKPCGSGGQEREGSVAGVVLVPFPNGARVGRMAERYPTRNTDSVCPMHNSGDAKGWGFNTEMPCANNESTADVVK